MNKIKIILLISIFIFGVSGFACGETEYDVIARNFLMFAGSEKTVASIEAIERNILDSMQDKVTVAYLVHLNGGGYILISASHNLTPIKAYSLERPFEALPEAYRNFLFLEAEYNIRYLTTLRTAQSTSGNQKRWEFLLTLDRNRSPLAYTPDTYLLKTSWNQGFPYNKFLPEIEGKNTLAGCVSVAIAQLMKYYNSPLSGSGVHSYTWNGQQLKTVLFRNFNWENMPDVLDISTPEYKIDEVALLIRDIGIVNNTLFGIDYSEASINVFGMMEYFGLSNTSKSMDNSTDINLFFNTLRSEIEAMRPVLLHFPGHLTVADGYGSDPSGRKIHVNMGWGGYANDYYYLDDYVNAGGVMFAPNLRIDYNIKPCSIGDCYTNLEAGDVVSGTTISGKFDMERDIDKYTLFLKGNTYISAGRGLQNIAFFVSIYDDATGDLVYKMDDKANAGTLFSVGNLSAGRYTVRVSLCNDTSSSSYNLDANDTYSVSIVTDTVSESEKTEITKNLDFTPVIGNDFKDIILNVTSTEPFKILIDARDENGDPVTIRVLNSNSNAVQTVLTKNILSIIPNASAAKSSTKITVQASANGKTTEKSFIVMLLNEDVSFGKYFTIKGIFESQNDFNSHKLVLDKQCKITGYNGYANQAFFSSIRDIVGNAIISPSSNSIDYIFTKNIYFLDASLQNGSFYYPYTTGHESYIFTVRCPKMDDSTSTIAELFGIDLSGSLEKPATNLLLSAGWNFISFPSLPSDKSVTKVFADVSSNVRIIWGYDNQNKKWQVYKPKVQGSTFDVIENIESGKGYWVYMDASGNIDMTGWTASTAPIPLYPGWNLIGYNGNDGTINPPSGWVIIWNWENSTWKAKKAPEITGTLNVPELTTLEKGKAYWIKMTEAATNWTQP